MNQQNRWYTFSITILFLGLGWIWFSRAPQEATTQGTIPSPFPGFVAPDFTLQDGAQDDVSLSSLRGSPVVVNFWASWCLPCRSEMPAIEDIYQEYSSQGVNILAINATNQDDLSSALSFIDEYGLTFPVLFDQDGQVSNSYQVQSLPTTFFIDQKGIIQDIVIGGMSDTLLKIKVEELLGNAPMGDN